MTDPSQSNLRHLGWVRGELDGPSRTIIVEPLKTPTPAPREPEYEPPAPAPVPEREPEKVPA